MLPFFFFPFFLFFVVAVHLIDYRGHARVQAVGLSVGPLDNHLDTTTVATAAAAAAAVVVDTNKDANKEYRTKSLAGTSFAT